MARAELKLEAEPEVTGGRRDEGEVWVPTYSGPVEDIITYMKDAKKRAKLCVEAQHAETAGKYKGGARSIREVSSCMRGVCARARRAKKANK